MTSEPTIAEQVAALQRLSTAELITEYTRVCGRPPHARNRTWLWRRTAWELQAQHFGRLPQEAQDQLDEIIRTQIEPHYANGLATRKPSKPGTLLPGTTLSRTWHGREVRLHVTDASFVVDGVPHTSLSAAAFAVTGQRWNGRLFWGLTKRSTKEPAT